MNQQDSTTPAMIDHTAPHWQSGQPSPAEIKARAADIRATWTEAERQKRFRIDGLAGEWPGGARPPPGALNDLLIILIPTRTNKPQKREDRYGTYLPNFGNKMKRLNTRLKELEQHSGTNAVEMSAAEKRMLVGVLGRRDALFWPWRWTLAVKPPMCEIRRRQREYLNESIGISAKADGKSDWKEAHSQRRTLIDAGMLTATSSKGQITSLFLTPLGESSARALVGDRLVEDRPATILFMLLGRLSDPTGTPVREHVLLDVPSFGNPEDWSDQTELILPALTSGAVSACSDTMGRILFTPVEGMPELPEVDVEPEEWCDGVYTEAFNAERHVLTNAEPRDPAEVFIPIPATVLWPCQSESDTHE